MATVPAKKIKQAFPEHAAAIEAEREELATSPKKKWDALSTSEKDAVMKKLALTADLILED